MDATDLAFAGIARQAELVRDGEVSPRELVDVCLERIERLDPELNAFRVVFAERARAEAEQAAGRRGAGGAAERPLLGVPVAAKDNLNVAGEVSAMGSRGHGGPAQADAEVVRRLRAAGAIVIGKTNMSELAIFPWTETEAFGPTRNPWDRSRSPGGSSGGSAVAAAAGLVGAAYASDGGGSIRIPASCNGIFGLKPQRGRVTLSPDPQHWYGLSQVGCVTRRVVDTALWLDVVAGPAPGDAHSAPAPSRSFVELASTPPGKLRIALSFKPSTRARVEPAVRAAVERVADVLRGLGHEVVERDPDYGWIEPLFVPRWLRGIHDDVERIADPSRTERHTRMLALGGRIVGRRGAERALRGEPARTGRINEVLRDHDLLLTPTMPVRPEPIGRYDGKPLVAKINGATRLVAFTSPWNTLGQPAASLPAPVGEGELPIGAELIGRPNDEATILSLSAQLEAELGWPERRPPL